MLMIGTSGWQYADWRGDFYPAGLPVRTWLEHYASRFATVEVNNAFYRLPEQATFASWRDRTPDDFRIAVKMSRYLTHIKRLRDPAEPVARFLDRADGLGRKMGPVLLQLPPNLAADTDLLADVLRRFPSSVRVAVEPRHPSWWTDATRAALTERGAALAWADRRSRPITPLWRTADWGYVRFHEGRAADRPRYGRTALQAWIDRIDSAFTDDADVYAYFNNDTNGAAIRDAIALGRYAAKRELTTSHMPVDGH